VVSSWNTAIGSNSNHSYRKKNTSKPVSGSSSKITTHVFRYATDEIITDSQIAPVPTVARVRHFYYIRMLDAGDSPGAVEALWRWPEARRGPLSWKLISTHLRLLVSLTSQDPISKTPGPHALPVDPFGSSPHSLRCLESDNVALYPSSLDSRTLSVLSLFGDRLDYHSDTLLGRKLAPRYLLSLPHGANP